MNEGPAWERVRRMLENDKEEMNEASKAAALRDFEHVAREYFELEGSPALTLKQGRRSTEVTLTFQAVRFKNFATIK